MDRKMSGEPCSGRARGQCHLVPSQWPHSNPGEGGDSFGVPPLSHFPKGQQSPSYCQGEDTLTDGCWDHDEKT